MVDVGRSVWTLGAGVLILLATGILPGCAWVPRARFEESQRLSQSLRTENARLKDQVVGLRTENRDYADRALDDLRRLRARDEGIQRLERSVQAYQDDRDRLEASYRRLAMSLGRTTEDSAVEPTSDRHGSARDPAPAVRSGVREEREAEGLAGQDDEDAGGLRPRASAVGSGP